MKQYITGDQLEELSENEKKLADSYYRTQGIGKPEYGAEFWNIGTMIEYLNEYAFLKSVLSPNENGWIDIYGFDLSGTNMNEWCDKLWTKVKETLKEDIKENPHKVW